MPLSDNRVDKVKAGDLWSPDVEKVFKEALALYPSCGRQRIPGESLGRNQLIARYIKSHTGQVRTRKQISSHIQVLARREARKIYGKMNATGAINWDSPTSTSMVDRVGVMPSTPVGVDGFGNMASGFGNMAAGLGNMAAGLGNMAADVGNMAADVGHPASGVGNMASGIGNMASGVGNMAPGVGSQYPSDMAHQNFSLYPSNMAYENFDHHPSHTVSQNFSQYPSQPTYQNFQYGANSTAQHVQPAGSMIPYWEPESRMSQPPMPEHHMASRHVSQYPSQVAYQPFQYGPDTTVQQGQPAGGMVPYWKPEPHMHGYC